MKVMEDAYRRAAEMPLDDQEKMRAALWQIGEYVEEFIETPPGEWDGNHVGACLQLIRLWVTGEDTEQDAELLLRLVDERTDKYEAE